MKKAAFITKAILFPLILLAGVVGLVLFCRASLRFPHLHLALSEIRLKTLCFLAAGLLCAAFAVVAAEYILFNFKEAYWKLLIPAAGALVLLAVCGLCFRQALRPLAYTYTEALSDYEADFNADRFQTPEEQLFPDPVTGTVTGYRLYRDGPLEAEIVTVTYELAPFYTEQRRIQRMGLSGFKLDEERYCYELPTEDCLYQVDLNDETHQIFYRRFVQVDSLPAYAPHPETEPEEPDARPGLLVRLRDVGRDAVRREDLPASADKLTLLLIGETRELREVVQREEAAALRRVDVVAAVHRDGPAFGAERFDHVKEVRPRRADVQGRVPVVRHDADQRLHIVSRTERPEPVKFLPVHSGRDVIHSNCDLHTYRLLIQGPCRA